MSTWYIGNLILENDAHSEKCERTLQHCTWTPVHYSRSNSLVKYAQPRVVPQVLAAVFSCWVNLASGASVAYITPALQTLQKPESSLEMSDVQGSWIASLTMLGAFLGGISAGPCIAFGRRRALWLVAFPLASSWVVVIVASAVWYLCVAHFLMGVCMAVVADASQVYVCEIVSADWRGSLGCVPVLMFNLGMLLCWCAGAWLEWDHLAVFCAALTLPALVLPLWLPETPSYLVSHSCTEQALASLSWLRGKRCDINSEYQLVMGVSLAGLGSFFYFYDESDCARGSALGWVPLAAILVYIVCNSAGLGPVSGILIGELVPQRHRNLTSSVTSAGSWLGAFVVTKTFVDLDRSVHLSGTMWLYCAMCLVGLAFVFFALPETRGLSQYAIDNLFASDASLQPPLPTSRRHSSLTSIDFNKNQTRF
ncbi:facilitated trehalose transporter Tret1-like [Bacillus rossius redtenbacheri]|uniref:facilitated trehalose transporter Tret1-like n=1 Tax=Bacillus rossius redtenbacheri TaxID=93214 RepID=UPI002FDC9732